MEVTAFLNQGFNIQLIFPLYINSTERHPQIWMAKNNLLPLYMKS